MKYSSTTQQSASGPYALTGAKRASSAMRNRLMRLCADSASTVSNVQRRSHSPNRSLPLRTPLPEMGHSR
jgi:hypothetical protein